MTTVASLRGSTHQVICGKCGDALIAPEWAEYVSEQQVIINLWSCMRCGNRFATEALVSADIEPENESEILEQFFPSLLVA